jgi:hypothetical protein
VLFGARSPRWSCEIAALTRLPIWSASALPTLQAWVAESAQAQDHRPPSTEDHGAAKSRDVIQWTQPALVRSLSLLMRPCTVLASQLATAIGLPVVAIAIVSAATNSVSSAGYLAVFIALPSHILIAIVVLAMGAIAAWGVKESVSFAGVMTVVEIGGLLLKRCHHQLLRCLTSAIGNSSWGDWVCGQAHRRAMPLASTIPT